MKHVSEALEELDIDASPSELRQQVRYMRIMIRNRNIALSGLRARVAFLDSRVAYLQAQISDASQAAHKQARDYRAAAYEDVDPYTDREA